MEAIALHFDSLGGLEDGVVLSEWMQQQTSARTHRPDLMKTAELHEQSRRVLAQLGPAMASGRGVDEQPWDHARELVAEISRERARRGFSTAETATFVLSLKQALFQALRRSNLDRDALAAAMWSVTAQMDELALVTFEAFQKEREEVIARQQQELLELSTPVVKLWNGVLALPLIGTLDSARTQVVMESLLNEIVASRAAVAIIDITGVPTVDTLVAQYLLKTVAAARLMGTECIISGIRPQIAQSIVHLGVDLGSVITKASLADAFALALKRTGKRIVNDAA